MQTPVSVELNSLTVFLQCRPPRLHGHPQYGQSLAPMNADVQLVQAAAAAAVAASNTLVMNDGGNGERLDHDGEFDATTQSRNNGNAGAPPATTAAATVSGAHSGPIHSTPLCPTPTYAYTPYPNIPQRTTRTPPKPLPTNQPPILRSRTACPA